MLAATQRRLCLENPSRAALTPAHNNAGNQLLLPAAWDPLGKKPLFNLELGSFLSPNPSPSHCPCPLIRVQDAAASTTAKWERGRGKQMRPSREKEDASAADKGPDSGHHVSMVWGTGCRSQASEADKS